MTDTDAADTNRAQRDYWNSQTALKWTVNADRLDGAFARLTARILALAAPVPGERVVDIGCGAGATTIAAARAVAPGGEAIGFDLSQALVDLAGERIAAAGVSARVICADAQTAALAAPADVAISRFGVMFFDDPTAAFANIRAMLRPGGRAVLAAWAAMEDNAWFDLPRRAAIAQLGPVEPAAPREPGPLALAEPDYFRDLLAAAGFADVQIRDERLALVIAEPTDEAARLVSSVGPAARILRERNGTQEDAAAIVAATARAIEPFLDADGVHLPARLNIAVARR